MSAPYHANEFDLCVLADDGCPHHGDDAEPCEDDSEFTVHVEPVPLRYYSEPNDDPSYAALGGLWREIAPGVLTDRRTVQLWHVEPAHGFVLVLLCVDKR